MDLQIGDVIQVLPRKELSDLWIEHFSEALENVYNGKRYINELCGRTATIKSIDETRGKGNRTIHTEEDIERGHWAIYEWGVVLIKGMDLSPTGDFTALFRG